MFGVWPAGLGDLSRLSLPHARKAVCALSSLNLKTPLKAGFLNLAKTGDRTPDLPLTKRLLYQLSYLGKNGF